MTATLCLTFDNLGEAAEVGAGARDPAAPAGSHPTATDAVPAILEELARRRLAATFFVEGLNAEVYPDLLRRIDAGGHEVAYHAWTHELWGELAAADRIENLGRGVEAFERIGLALSGMRPPGGSLGAGGVEILREAGLAYASPAGVGTGVEDGLALLPFDWRHVDATCVLPGLGSVRARIAGSDAAIEPERWVAHLGAELDRLAAGGGFATFVLHPFMLDWLGTERLETLLDRVAGAAAAGELWVAPCREVAAHVLAHPGPFEGAAALDPTTWSGLPPGHA